MNLDDRMKLYESSYTRKLTPLLPAFARLDGKAFHSFCRGLEKPYDLRLSEIMQRITKSLVESTNANLGYTQSDEITLMWYSDNYDSQIYFSGKINKMVSVLAATCSVLFNDEIKENIPEKESLKPVFDCRVWNVPTLDEAANVFLWRELDATRNSIESAARSHYSHKQLHGINGKEMQKMLLEKDVNWNDYPSHFKRGTYYKKVMMMKPIPEKYRKQGEPIEVERGVVIEMDWPPLIKTENRIELLFNGKLIGAIKRNEK